MNAKVQTILPTLRQFVLAAAVKRGDPKHQYPTYPLDFFVLPGMNRGHVQAALAILAREGLVFTRRHPEDIGFKGSGRGGDKRFKIRISPRAAKQRLDTQFQNT